tara:strand:- start:2915 stop:3940 length:1026 start_codon:yes stop_codon:yes gene_type:complete
MYTTQGFLLVSGMLCAGVSFFLSGLETGLVEVSRLRLRRMAREGNVKASQLLRYLDESENTLWTILVGNTVANVYLALVGLYGLAHILNVQDLPQLLKLTSHAGIFWSLYLSACLLFYSFCELFAKMLFRQYATRLTVMLIGLFRWVELILSPLVGVLKFFSELLLLSPVSDRRQSSLFGSREELRQLMTESGQGLTNDERVMIDRVLDLQNIPVRELAKPFEDFHEIYEDFPVGDVVRNFKVETYTRLPVWTGADSNRRIAGVVDLRRLIFLDESEWHRPVGHFVESALYQDEDVRLQKLLQTMQRSGQRVIIVLDKRKREMGMVSLPDILKVVFGRVRV